MTTNWIYKKKKKTLYVQLHILPKPSTCYTIPDGVDGDNLQVHHYLARSQKQKQKKLFKLWLMFYWLLPVFILNLAQYFFPSLLQIASKFQEKKLHKPLFMGISSPYFCRSVIPRKSQSCCYSSWLGGQPFSLSTAPGVLECRSLLLNVV